MLQARLDALSERYPRFGRFRTWVKNRWSRLKIVFIITMHVLGFFSSVQAIMSTRTSQGAIAWVVSLNTYPYIAVPAYWVFGRSRFDGYHVLRRAEMLNVSEAEQRAMTVLREQGLMVNPRTPSERRQVRLMENLAMLPLTGHNDADLLIDGNATFEAIFSGIEKARDYVLVQFYILRDDGLGQQLKRVLLDVAKRGVRVFVLYDELGSHQLSQAYVRELVKAGVQVVPFNTTKGSGNRFRVNFRNHRKIVVVDGKEAFVGGHNVGDEYLGKDPKLSPWRDTHVAVRGPVVLEAQVAFIEDWQWATDQVLEGLNWIPEKAPEGDTVALCLPTGPADAYEAATLFFLNAINSAEKRIWIVSPYFVPDVQLVSALQLAALRGVDVKVLIPENPDQMLVYLSSFSYLQEAEKCGVEIWRYQPGFLHQKVMLIDDQYSTIGTANFDNRSMRLNFEVTMFFADEEFAAEVESMLVEDFSNSRQVSYKEYTDASFPFRLGVRVARLLAPVQ